MQNSKKFCQKVKILYIRNIKSAIKTYFVTHPLEIQVKEIRAMSQFTSRKTTRNVGTRMSITWRA